MRPRGATSAALSPSATLESDLVWIPGGTFWMGSDHHYAEERPAHAVHVDGFWMDRCEVTNADFDRFVQATGHVTVAERPPRREDYPDIPAPLLVPGSAVFRQTPAPLDVSDPLLWWYYVPGACWRHPEGPGSGIEGRLDHPVVHVAYQDAEAYAAWIGKSIPTEAEWELAARGGLDRLEYCWGGELTPAGRCMANIWRGRFPWENLAEKGAPGTTPVGSFPPNGYGLHDMAGNVWEWTRDWFLPHHIGSPLTSWLPRNPTGPRREDTLAAEFPSEPPRRVLKGGSFLCAPSHCQRYRPAARLPQAVDTSTCHVGFRLLSRRAPPADR